jgi:hypothetical protein
MVAGVLVVGWPLRNPPAPMVVQEHGDVCLALLVVRDALLMDRVPPPFPTDAQIHATAEVNADLAQVRERLFALDGIRQLGCQRGG